MKSNKSFCKERKALVTAKYYSPDTSHEQGSTQTVKCASLVEKYEGKHAQFVKVKLNADPIFGKLLWRQITSSRYFCVHLSLWLYYQLKNITQRNAEQLPCVFDHVINLGKSCSLHIQGEENQMNNLEVCKIHVKISIQPLTCLCLEPDVRWSKRLLANLVEYMQLHDVMAWLATLGGAYSAMGDHLYSYSKKAGQISQHQLLVATRLGNPLLAAQCKVFAALSLIQRGQLKLASKIIREQYALATSNGMAKDDKLISSCKAAWYRIQYLRKQKKINQQAMK